MDRAVQYEQECSVISSQCICVMVITGEKAVGH